jgi:tRNA threonylcarbamoyladenosine biosynthesis protein TsaB
MQMALCYPRAVRWIAIESSGPRGSVAAGEDGACAVELCHQTLSQHAEALPQLLEQVLATLGWARTSLDAVAVGVGPGSFTGLRVGIALAQGVALGLGRPLHGVSSLKALAHAAREGDAACFASAPARWFGALVDAHRSEYFLALYDSNLRLLAPPQAVVQARWLEELDSQLLGAGFVAAHGVAVPGCLVGDLPQGLEYPVERRTSGAALAHPSARSVLLLAQSGDVEADAQPQYLRPPDAIIPKIVPHPLLEQLGQ